jgi:hypothetical protein
MGTGPFFSKKIGFSNEFITQKVYFSRLLRVYVVSIMLAPFTLSRIPCFLLVSRVSPCFSMAGGLEGNDQYSANQS